MCAAHRSDKLAVIRQRLDEDKTCRLISTQLIEAGVDVDFPIAYRALGPLDLHHPDRWPLQSRRPLARTRACYRFQPAFGRHAPRRLQNRHPGNRIVP